MTILLNGSRYDAPAGTDLAALIRTLGLGDSRLAAEINGRILPRDRHAGTVLAEGDRVEIVRFVGGG